MVTRISLRPTSTAPDSLYGDAGAVLTGGSNCLADNSDATYAAMDYYNQAIVSTFSGFTPPSGRLMSIDFTVRLASDATAGLSEIEMIAGALSGSGPRADLFFGPYNKTGATDQALQPSSAGTIANLVYSLSPAEVESGDQIDAIAASFASGNGKVWLVGDLNSSGAGDSAHFLRYYELTVEFVYAPSSITEQRWPVRVRKSILSFAPTVDPVLVGGAADEVWDGSTSSYSYGYTASTSGFETFEQVGDVVPWDLVAEGAIGLPIITLTAMAEQPGAGLVTTSNTRGGAAPTLVIGPYNSVRPSSDPTAGGWVTNIKLGRVDGFSPDVERKYGGFPHQWQGVIWHDSDTGNAPFTEAEIRTLFASGFSVSLFESASPSAPAPPGGPKMTYYGLTFEFELPTIPVGSIDGAEDVNRGTFW